jgi:flap endonuclease-1
MFSHLKRVQVERRREVRKVVAARGLMESVRLKRLRRLSVVIKSWGCLSNQTKEAATNSLRELMHAGGPNIPTSTYPDNLLELPEMMSPLRRWTPAWDPEAYTEAYGEFNIEELKELFEDAGASVSASDELDTDSRGAIPTIARSYISLDPYEEQEPILDELSAPQKWSLNNGVSSSPEEVSPSEFAEGKSRQPSRFVEEMGKDIMLPDVEEVISSLLPLYIDYRASTRCLESLAQTTSASLSLSGDDGPETTSEHLMSKNQQQLTADEGTLWSRIADLTVTEEEIEASSTDLTNKSTMLSESYARRVSLPTVQTYDESKEIIRAMGVPCIEPSGPFEAEALAASLVLQGQADYVASEDTVMFLYLHALFCN